jgi:hypothetical protein
MYVNESFKFKGMLKAQEFTIYPCKENDPVILLQSDKRMVKVEIAKKKAIISKSWNYPTVWHCQLSLGAKDLSLDDDTIDKIKSMVKRMSLKTTKERTIQLIG